MYRTYYEPIHGFVAGVANPNGEYRVTWYKTSVTIVGEIRTVQTYIAYGSILHT